MNKVKLTVSSLALGLILLFTACITVNPKNDTKYKIFFMVDEAVYHTIETAGSEMITLPSEPEKTGYIFDGWYFDNNQTLTNTYYLNTALTENVAVNAKWRSENGTYSAQTLALIASQVDKIINGFIKRDSAYQDLNEAITENLYLTERTEVLAAVAAVKAGVISAMLAASITDAEARELAFADISLPQAGSGISVISWLLGENSPFVALKSTGVPVKKISKFAYAFLTGLRAAVELISVDTFEVLKDTTRSVITSREHILTALDSLDGMDEGNFISTFAFIMDAVYFANTAGRKLLLPCACFFVALITMILILSDKKKKGCFYAESNDKSRVNQSGKR